MFVYTHSIHIYMTGSQIYSISNVSFSHIRITSTGNFHPKDKEICRSNAIENNF